MSDTLPAMTTVDVAVHCPYCPELLLMPTAIFSETVTRGDGTRELTMCMSIDHVEFSARVVAHVEASPASHPQWVSYDGGSS